MKKARSKGKRIAVGAGLAAGLILLAALFFKASWLALGFPAGQEAAADTLVIDAGHGGFDGGAVSKNGTSEKNINLQIALELARLAEKDGWKVIMTRTEDVGLEEDGDERKAIRTKKTEDLKNRKRLIDKARPLAAVSIHLNSFQQDSSVRGAQTFYPSQAKSSEIVEESKRLAEAIQRRLVEGIDDGTRRKAMGKKDVLLLKNPTAVTVIVECGFLSNEEDEKNLKNPDFQRKLSEFIYEGIWEFSGKKRAEPLLILDSVPS